MSDVFKWADICERFSDGVLLGNGASIAVYDRFHYASLYEVAKEQGHLSEDAIQIFNAFNTTDFEFVLRRLWQAQLVNQALSIEMTRVDGAYREVRNALIATVLDCHVSYDTALPYLPMIYKFMKHFKTVVSLNYDLVCYWAMMAGNRELGPWFKDAFLKNYFREDWEEVRNHYGCATGATLVFYPHGNLILARKSDGEEVKLQVGDGPDLLNAILNRWKSGDVVPLFISEGTADQKRRSIENTSYMHRVFREVIPKLGNSLVIYGWSASSQDKHIIEQVSLAKVNRVAVSVHGDYQEFMIRIEKLFRNLGVEEVIFFDSESSGCWIHPESVAAGVP